MYSNKTILIIDDDDDDRALFSEALREIDRSIKCLSANGGREGLLLLNNSGIAAPDLIFLDLNMPLINGRQCLEEIKKHIALVHIPVVIYSTTKRIEDVNETKRLGADHFLTKPILFNDICNSIKALLEEKWGKNTPL